jgi:release factor glutamine methyltransferase
MDMGSGSGVVSIFAASKGADCTAVDINPIAIRCIKENAARNKLDAKIVAIESDLFVSVKNNPLVKKGFDFIFFNPPYYKGIPKNNFERAFLAGTNLDVIDNFLAEARNFLLPHGKICFIVSSDMDRADLENRFRKSGYSFEIVKSIHKSLETFYIIESVTI